MENKIEIFKNEEFGEIRTVVIDNEPWFVGKDVAIVLGYTNPSKALSDHVDEEDKLNNDSLSSSELNLGQRGGWLINESGLYSLVMSSKLESAKAFKRWVTSEVLPSIRKHGLYAVDELIANPDLAIAALTALKEEREKNALLKKEKALLTETVSIKDQQITEMQPKVTYYDTVLQCKELLPISVIAKDFGWSGRRMNQYLHDKGVQYKQGKVLLLYQKYAEMGYTSTKTNMFIGNDGEEHMRVNTYWTQKGRLFLYDTLKTDGALPLIEQTA